MLSTRNYLSSATDVSIPSFDKLRCHHWFDTHSLLCITDLCQFNSRPPLHNPATFSYLQHYVSPQFFATFSKCVAIFTVLAHFHSFGHFYSCFRLRRTHFTVWVILTVFAILIVLVVFTVLNRFDNFRCLRCFGSFAIFFCAF